MHMASKDGFVPPEAQEKIKAVFTPHNHITLHVYEGQDHAFARPGGEHYDAAATTLANDRTVAFFRENLGS
jgi:carboxymethylenebutenolidase